MTDFINKHWDKCCRGFKPKKTGDVGHDLFVDMERTAQTWLDNIISFLRREEVVVIWPMTNKLLSSGIFLAMPDGIWAKIEARSSTSRKRLHQLGGIIDSGYRGELHAVLHNSGFIPRVIRDGERYVQVIFHLAQRPILKEVPMFTDVTSRGATGFGSSGQ